MNSHYLLGQSVYLRALDRADASLLQSFINHADVHPTIAAWRPVSIEQEADFVDRMSRSETDVVMGISTRADDRLIGVTGLHQIDWRNRNACFGIAIGNPVEWGKGYGTEATRLITGYGFGRLNLHRIYLDVYAANARGIHAYEKAGYRREGIFRDAVFRDGTYGDAYRMSLLASEWTASSGK